MSYDMSLHDPVTKEVLHAQAKHEIAGGTYCMGGTTELSLNITYNYARFYRREDILGEEKGIRVIYGMTGAESIPVLKAAAEKLKNDVHEDYWQPTEGNAKQALMGLIALAQLRPDGVWDGD